MMKYALLITENKSRKHLLGISGIYNSLEKAQKSAEILEKIHKDSYLYIINNIDWED